MSDFNNNDIDLSVWDEDYEAAPIEENKFDDVPDGKYQVAIEKVELARAQSSGNPMLKWQLRVLGPNHAGRMIFRNSVMATAENIKYLKNDLHTCGLVLERFSDLGNRLNALLDIKLEVTKKTRGEFSNVYINRRIVTEDPDDNYKSASKDALSSF
ncbi:MAG TPA: DUF669 domain-containing protein [bacterium]|nr:DUF669 domain-containing protein [bacterium]